MNETILLVALLLASSVALVLTVLRLRRLGSKHDELTRAHAELHRRFQPVIDLDREKQRVLGELDAQRTQLLAASAQVKTQQAQERQRLVEEHEAQRAQLSAATAQVRTQQAQERQLLTAELTTERTRQHLEIERARLEQEKAALALREQGAQARVELQSLHSVIAGLRAEFAALDEESNLLSFGFYKPRYDFADSERYQARLDDIRDQLKARIKDKTAAVCAIEWTVNGSKAEGKKQINQTLKLLLRAFNGESDAAIAKVRYNNIHVMETRIRKARETINSLAEIQSCTITDQYLKLKLEELFLVHEYEEKVQAERDEQRRIREQMREEEVALREIEKARLEAEKEESRFAEALRKAREEVSRATGNKHEKLQAQVAELERKLSEAHTNKERALSRAQMTRSGHVYIISNLGSFGEQVYKIGMTRRLDPLDRVKELGDASVPFEFDVHAILYTEDAPALENKLHRAFHHRRVNRVNHKKEFFRVDLMEIVAFVRSNHSAEIEIVHAAEAAEYRKTLALIQQEQPALTA